jgi:hypothetical protein
MDDGNREEFNARLFANFDRWSPARTLGKRSQNLFPSVFVTGRQIETGVAESGSEI